MILRNPHLGAGMKIDAQGQELTEDIPHFF